MPPRMDLAELVHDVRIPAREVDNHGPGTPESRKKERGNVAAVIILVDAVRQEVLGDNGRPKYVAVEAAVRGAKGHQDQAALLRGIV